MDDWSEPWLFALFLGKALWYALAGGAIMGLLDFASRYFLKGEDPKKLYPWALGASFVLGMFMQWQGMHRELEQLKTPQPVAQDEGSRKTIADLRQQLNGKELELGELKRLKDRAEDAIRREVSEKAALRNRLEGKDQRIKELETKQTDKERRAVIREQLGRFILEGMQLKVKCVTDPVPPKTEYAGWIRRIEDFIQKNLDTSFIAEFHSGVTAYGPNKVLSEEHANLWSNVHVRIENLKDIKKRFDS